MSRRKKPSSGATSWPGGVGGGSTSRDRWARLTRAHTPSRPTARRMRIGFCMRRVRASMVAAVDSSLRVLAVVPARGGSKGIPRKNLRLLAGKPLVAHAVAAGLAAELVERVVCSTDDPEIADAARQAGAEVPFLRP